MVLERDRGACWMMVQAIVASQLVKLLVMVVIVNLYTITRLKITDCNIGGCGKKGTHGNK